MIPECDIGNNSEYSTNWLENVIPVDSSGPAKCHRYEGIAGMWNLSEPFDPEYCAPQLYNQSKIVRCDQNGLVYKNDKTTIVSEFNLTCEENKWKLMTVGSYNNLARCIFTPLTGLISDR